MNAPRLVIVIVIVTLGSGGCAAVGLTGAALGAGAFSAGTGAVIDAGREYTRGGVVYRTFSLPPQALRLALSEALERMEVAVMRDEMVGIDRRIVARARNREIHIALEPVTRTVTRLRLVVEEGSFRKDRATATEIVKQTELTAARRTGASSLVRGGPR